MESTQWSTRGRMRYLNMLCFFPLTQKLYGKFQRWVTVQVKRGLKDSHFGGWRFLIGSENGL